MKTMMPAPMQHTVKWQNIDPSISFSDPPFISRLRTTMYVSLSKAQIQEVAQNRSANHAYPQFPFKAQCRLTSRRGRATTPASLLWPRQPLGNYQRATHHLHLKALHRLAMRMWRNQTRCVDAKRPHMECNSRCVFNPRKRFSPFHLCPRV